MIRTIDMPAVWGDALTPRDPRSVSEWCDANRSMPTRYGGHGGLWSTRTVPHTKEILDLTSSSVHDEITVCKGTRCAGSETMYGAMMWMIANAPAPALYVLDNQDAAGEEATGRLKATIESSPGTRALIPHAGFATEKTIHLRTCVIYMAWATSQATLGRRTVSWIYVDELDQCAMRAGRLGDTAKLIRERYATVPHHRRMLMHASQPTFDDAPTWTLFEASDQRRWYVPCPVCGCYQNPKLDHIKWPKDATADAIEIEGLAQFECEHCKERSAETRKDWMNDRGVWIPAGVEISGALDVHDTDQVAAASIDGGSAWKPRTKGKGKRTRHAGFHVWRFLVPWFSMSQIAAAFLKSLVDHDSRRTFVNGWLGEAYVAVEKTNKQAHADARIDRELPRGRVPDGTVAITSGIDVQERSAYGSVWAWGPLGERSLIDHIHVEPESEDGLEAMAEVWRLIVETEYTTAGGEKKVMGRILIDSGFATDAVYAFVKRPAVIRKARTFAARGMTRAYDWLFRLSQWYFPRPDGSRPSKPDGVLVHVNTVRAKNMVFASLTTAAATGPGATHLHAEADEDLSKQLTSEHEIRVRGRLVWKPKSAGRANHYFDTAVLALVGAAMMRKVLDAGEGAEGTPHTARRRRPGRGAPWMRRSKQKWIK